MEKRRVEKLPHSGSTAAAQKAGSQSPVLTAPSWGSPGLLSQAEERESPPCCSSEQSLNSQNPQLLPNFIFAAFSDKRSLQIRVPG